MRKIKEIVVVEGKSDVVAVKRAFKGNIDVVATHGLGIKKDLLLELAELQERKGIIVLTDPDYAGKRIANIIRENIPDAKFANISKSNATKNKNIGVENASDESIISAINNARPEFQKSEDIFTMHDINQNGLNGRPNSKDKRISLCKELSIRYTNAKQLLVKLNAFGITKNEFQNAIDRIENEQR